MPQLIERLGAGEAGGELEQWIDQSLESYGSDGRLLVRNGVRSFLRAGSIEPAVRASLELLFSLRGNEESSK